MNICILLDLVGFLLTLNYVVRNREFKKNIKTTFINYIDFVTFSYTTKDSLKTM